MAVQSSPTLRRRRLGRRLRLMRERAGLTLDEAAAQLDKTRSALNRMENGKARIDVHIVRTMMDVYDERDDTLLDLARESLRRGWWTMYGIRDLGYIGMETEASIAWDLELVNIPGLLQTEQYMRAMLGSGRVRWTAEQLENHVAARLHRQSRLTDDEAPLELHAIIDEAALRKRVGGADAMRAQLRWLVERADLDTVAIQVVPDDFGTHVGMDGAFTILGFVEEEDPDLLYIEYPTGSLHVEKADEVAEAKMVFNRLRTDALTPRDSTAFIERIAGGL